MHGLMNRAIQNFICDTYGHAMWDSVVKQAAIGISEFEAMLIYDDPLTEKVLDGACHCLSKTRASVLEDIGTYLISDPQIDAPRRLLRFSGISYEDFLLSLDELPDRAKLAISDLTLPKLELCCLDSGGYVLLVDAKPQGFGHVMVGVLRALADDYGALVMLEHHGTFHGQEKIEITLVEAAFSKGRDFELGART